MDLKNIVATQQEQTARFHEEKQAERDSIFELRTEAIELVTNDPASYAGFLEMAGKIPYYKAGNVALIYRQRENATRVGNEDFWKKHGRKVVDVQNPIRIIKPNDYYRNTAVQSEMGGQVNREIVNQSGTGVEVSFVYDVSQTMGGDIQPDRINLQNNEQAMEAAISSLLLSSKVTRAVDDTLTVPAHYDEKEMILYLSPSAPGPETFRALTEEVTHARIHAFAVAPFMTGTQINSRRKACPTCCASGTAWNALPRLLPTLRRSFQWYHRSTKQLYSTVSRTLQVISAGVSNTG